MTSQGPPLLYLADCHALKNPTATSIPTGFSGQEVLVYQFPLSLGGQAVVVAQLVLQVGELAVERVRRVGHVQLPPLLEHEQMGQIVAQAPIGTSQGLVGIERLAGFHVC